MLIIAFVLVEAYQASHPIMPIRLFLVRNFAVAAVANFMIGFSSAWPSWRPAVTWAAAAAAGGGGGAVSHLLHSPTVHIATTTPTRPPRAVTTDYVYLPILFQLVMGKSASGSGVAMIPLMLGLPVGAAITGERGAMATSEGGGGGPNSIVLTQHLRACPAPTRPIHAQAASSASGATTGRTCGWAPSS